MRATTRLLAAAAAAALPLTVLAGDAAAQSCAQTSPFATHGAPELQQFATTSGGGLIFDTVANELVLNKQAGVISDAKAFAPGQTPEIGCAADFDEDGWTDFVGVSEDGGYIGFFKNRTLDNQPGSPNWQDPMYFTPPKFTWEWWIESVGGNPAPPQTGSGGSNIGCGDFNADGHQDFFLILEKGGGQYKAYRSDMFLGDGDGTFQLAYPIASTEEFKGLRRDTTAAVVDYNGDGRLDFLFGAKVQGQNAGFVKIFLNNGGTSPTFSGIGTDCSDAVVANRPFKCAIPVGAYGTSGVAYMDFNRDGIKDLAVTGIGAANISLYYGTSGGGLSATVTVIDDPAWTIGAGQAGAQSLIAGDFDLDGYNDILVATNASGRTFMFKDHGAPTYVDHAADLSLTESFTDLDLGFGLNYDNDPAGTLDFMIGDYNSGQGYAVFANRLYDQYVTCGEVVSDALDLGALATEEMVVTAARIDPTAIVPGNGASIEWYASNEDPANWQLATPCVDDTTQYCVAFPKPSGRAVRWRAYACSDTLAHIQSPTINQVQVRFDYALAATHYRAGVVVNQGIAYVGGFRQPGDGGHFYAASAVLDTQFWDLGDTLGASGAGIQTDAERNIYTASTDMVTRLDFTTANASNTQLQATLAVGSDTEAAEVIAWQRSARFGVDLSTRLGAVLTSTPAVISKPVRPYFYGQMTLAGKAQFDAFATTYQNRPLVVLVGAKDGSIHAVSSNLTTPGTGGRELWAFIPPRIAAGFVADKANSTSNNYPDGSPTLADVKIGGVFRTVAIIGSGNGGKGFTALDVTDTVSTSGTVTGPIPLWDYVPGGGDAGQSVSKAAVIRTRVNGVERFQVVMATGPDYNNMTPPYAKGLDVEAVDVATGQRMWRFRAECPVTTDVIGFETDDDAEPGTPAIDGFVDRVVFADLCGNVYKIDPAVELPGTGTADGWTTGIGSIATGATDPAGQPVDALFSVADTTGAIGEERPIAGTIGTRSDDTGRLSLFFGTGGSENFDVTKQNAFYSIYADDGTIRDQLAGTCNGPGGACQKFYGGIVVTSEQVLVTRAIDPPIATSTCDLGSAEIVGLDVVDLGLETTMYTASAAMVSSLYGDQGALYATTLGGQVVRVGTPAVPTPGQGTPNPTTPASLDPNAPVIRRSWRELLD